MLTQSLNVGIGLLAPYHIGVNFIVVKKVYGLRFHREVLECVNQELKLKNLPPIPSHIHSRAVAFATIINDYQITKVLYSSVSWGKLCKALPRDCLKKELSNLRKHKRQTFNELK